MKVAAVIAEFLMKLLLELSEFFWGTDFFVIIYLFTENLYEELVL
jgi:hypothetical protein